MTDNTDLAEIRGQLEELEQKSEEISEVLQQDRREVEIEIIDENVPVIAVNGVEMMPTEQVNRWFEDLRDGMNDVAEIAEEREQQREKLEQELDGLEQLMENPGSQSSDMEENGSWVECTIDKAYKSQDTLLEDGQYCALGPEFAEEVGLGEGEELEVRRADQPEKSAVYTVKEIRDQDAKVRIAKKGRQRIDGKGSFEGEVLPLDQ